MLQQNNAEPAQFIFFQEIFYKNSQTIHLYYFWINDSNTFSIEN